MNIERFHNEIAMRLGYERIVEDKIEEADRLWVVLKIQGYDDVRIKASDKSSDIVLKDMPILQNGILTIADAVHQA